MAKCEICGKGAKSGRSVSSSKKTTKRQFSPNIQRRLVTIDGKARRIHICTRCLRTLDKAK